MTLFARARNVITRALPSKRFRSRLQRPIASFTFDDFPKCAWTVGGPILASYGARGTYYVAGSRCGAFLDGTQQYDRQDLVELVAAGHEIGCHSFEHRSVLSVNNRDLRADLAKNALFVREAVGPITLTSYAYPHGDVDPRTKLLHGEAFSSSRGIQSGINAGVLDLAMLRVIPLHDIARRPALLAETIASAREHVGWIVFLTHDVQEQPLVYGCTPSLLAQTLQALASAGIEVLPVQEAALLATAGQRMAPGHAFRAPAS